jgi:aminoglycoside phosphotransferase family enzyme
VNGVQPVRLAAGPPRHRAPPDLDAKVAFLREPSSYVEPCFRVEAIETHMSWVFLLDRHVYKLKKPVHYELLDCRSLEARRACCQAELDLNLRLAPEVYLGVVPLTCDRSGHLALGGRGSVIDWLVRMVRLPTERMLDYAIAHGTLSEGDLWRAATRLHAFYDALPAEQLDCGAYRERFRNRIDHNRRSLNTPAFDLPPGHVRALAADQGAMLTRLGGLLDERVRAGHIVEGHGDLRPEHIYLGEPVAIIDCLEFSRALRIVDVADELGFLALECERLGSATAGLALLLDYAGLSGDTPPLPVLHFYQSCRATTRALIAARHLLDEKFRHSPHWLRRSGQYLQLAERHIRLAAA